MYNVERSIRINNRSDMELFFKGHHTHIFYSVLRRRHKCLDDIFINNYIGNLYKIYDGDPGINPSSIPFYMISEYRNDVKECDICKGFGFLFSNASKDRFAYNPFVYCKECNSLGFHLKNEDAVCLCNECSGKGNKYIKTEIRTSTRDYVLNNCEICKGKGLISWIDKVIPIEKEYPEFGFSSFETTISSFGKSLTAMNLYNSMLSKLVIDK